MSRALITLLTGPPMSDPGILASSDVTDLWRPAEELTWWEADDDPALALVCLDELERRGLEGVSAQWEGHPLLATARWTLTGPIRRGLTRLAEHSALPSKGSGCSTVRLILTMVATAPEPSITRRSSAPFRQSVALTALQRLRERDAHALLLPMLAGTSRRLVQEAVVACERPGATDGPREAIGEVLRALGLPDRTGAYLATVPGAALWRMATLRHLVSRRSLRAAALGWLVAADALAASGRAATGDALRSHGIDAALAQEWDRCVIGDLATLEAAEQLVDAEPALAADLILGARACMTSMIAVEDALADAGGDDPDDPGSRRDLTPTEGLT